MESNTALVVIEYLGVLFAGINGGLVAVHKKLDVFSIMVCAWITALGGGFIRDIAMGDIPPVGISNYSFILITCAAGIIVVFAHLELDSMYWPLIVTDALATALFAVDGTAKGLIFGFNGGTAIFLGMFTAFGGGTLRDILLKDIPLVIRDKHFYAVPTVVGCILTVFAMRSAMQNHITVGVEAALDIIIVAAVIAIRLLSVHFNLLVPGAMPRKTNQFQATKTFMTNATHHMKDRTKAWKRKPGNGRSAKNRRSRLPHNDSAISDQG
ncbi:trimeric intracellular cation channel family protein [Scardovia wiggsiae]|uniref:trimeric intracellular cation channel family protein n=1 Tax=Scardovia wiggsiae TaxID=230143 RepID=UPI001CB33F35|nr:TRIC cation channel family protein [Scardovia wiggsiae]MBF1674552.1 TRIC cation channel family protein [Scardovia wiggsiae]